MRHEILTERVIGCAMQVQGELGPGFLESVYKNSLAYLLEASELHVQREARFTVLFQGVPVGDFIADMVVNGVVLVEVKAAHAIAPAHVAQLINYLTATRIEVGLLLNFGSPQLQVRRRSLDYCPSRAMTRAGEDKVQDEEQETAGL